MNRDPARHARPRKTLLAGSLGGILLLLGLLATPVLLGWGLQHALMSQMLRPECTRRCAARGQALALITPSGRGARKQGGCVCADGFVDPWKAPDRLAMAQAGLVLGCYVVFGFGARIALRKRRFMRERSLAPRP